MARMISIFHLFIITSNQYYSKVSALILASDFIECQIYDAEFFLLKCECLYGLNGKIECTARYDCPLAALNASQVLHAMWWACKHLGSLFPLAIGRCTHSQLCNYSASLKTGMHIHIPLHESNVHSTNVNASLGSHSPLLANVGLHKKNMRNENIWCEKESDNGKANHTPINCVKTFDCGISKL